MSMGSGRGNKHFLKTIDNSNLQQYLKFKNNVGLTYASTVVWQMRNQQTLAYRV